MASVHNGALLYAMNRMLEDYGITIVDGTVKQEIVTLFRTHSVAPYVRQTPVAMWPHHMGVVRDLSQRGVIGSIDVDYVSYEAPDATERFGLGFHVKALDTTHLTHEILWYAMQNVVISVISPLVFNVKPFKQKWHGL